MTWMCLTIRLPVSRPLVSAFASAFLRRPSRNSADFTGHLARETPNCLPIHHVNILPARTQTFEIHLFKANVPCAARPVPPAYLLIGTASLCSWTFSRNLTARCNFHPLIAWAVSRVFLKETRKYAPRARADFVGWISVAAYRTYINSHQHCPFLSCTWSKIASSLLSSPPRPSSQ